MSNKAKTLFTEEKYFSINISQSINIRNNNNINNR